MISNNKIYLRTKYLSERRSMEKKEINSLSYSVTNKLQKMKRGGSSNKKSRKSKINKGLRSS